MLQFFLSLLDYSLQQFLNLIRALMHSSKQCDLQVCLMNLNPLLPTLDCIWNYKMAEKWDIYLLCWGTHFGSCWYCGLLMTFRRLFCCGTGCSLATIPSEVKGHTTPAPTGPCRAPALSWEGTLLLFPMQGCQIPRQVPQGMPRAFRLALFNLFLCQRAPLAGCWRPQGSFSEQGF